MPDSVDGVNLSIRGLIQGATSRLREAGITSGDVDAAILMGHVLQVSRGEVQRRAILGELLSSSQDAQYEALVAERVQRVPLQHLTGIAAFRHLELQVGPGVFVPRPETEMLVDAVLERCPVGGVVVDLCTGSGAIALAIAHERPDITVYAVEVDHLAASWARANIERLGLRVNLSVEPAQQALPALEGQVDVVVSNPPYVPLTMVPLDPEVADYDPRIALYGDSDDGLLIPLQVADRAAVLLKPGGYLVMEHADVQGETLCAGLLNSRGFDRAGDFLDAAGKPRMAVARREGGARFTDVPPKLADRPRLSRSTVRLIVVDDDGCALLVGDSDPGATPVHKWWSTPGGGIDPGEDERTAAVRELLEETGLSVNGDDFIGPVGRRHVIHAYFDQIVAQDDVFFVLQTARFEAKPAALTPEEKLTMQGYAWMSADAMRQAEWPIWPTTMPDMLDIIKGATKSGDVTASQLHEALEGCFPDVEESSVGVSNPHPSA